MTKNKYLYALLLLVIVPLYLKWRHHREAPVPAPAPSSPEHKVPRSPPVINVKKLEVNGKKVVGLKPGKEAQDIQRLKRVANDEDGNWEEALETHLREQGGEELASIKVKKLASVILAQDDLAINAVSAIVTVENKKNETTSFRVLVDAETGKVLKNWDQPVIDPVNPREGFGIKLDPRYHHE